MSQFMMKPTLLQFANCADFARELALGEKDLVITNDYIYTPRFGQLGLKCHVVFQEKYGRGEPTDDMAEAIWKDIRDIPFERLIAIGGGTVIDLCKLFVLEKVSPVCDLFDKVFPAVKKKQLLIVPTTCGTGSEVTNISILAFPSRGTKFGLADPALFADYAVLVPELLQGLPLQVFATSSIDALVHAVESYLSPKANSYTQMFSREAIRMILGGYTKLAKEGMEIMPQLMEQFLIASNYAGIAFSNAGCGAVHAMSYPLGAAFHVPHGESNYAMFTGIMNKYMELRPTGPITTINGFIADLLGCDPARVYSALEELLNRLLPKKALHEYGVTEADIPAFTKNVMEKQGRLMANNYTPLSEKDVVDIYNKLL